MTRTSRIHDRGTLSFCMSKQIQIDPIAAAKLASTKGAFVLGTKRQQIRQALIRERDRREQGVYDGDRILQHATSGCRCGCS